MTKALEKYLIAIYHTYRSGYIALDRTDHIVLVFTIMKGSHFAGHKSHLKGGS